MAKHHRIVGRIVRRDGYSYYIEGDGSIREFKLVHSRKTKSRKTKARKTKAR
jgi:hypothetical protein